VQKFLSWSRIVLVYTASFSLIGYTGFFLLWFTTHNGYLPDALALSSYFALVLVPPTLAVIAIERGRLKFLNNRVLIGIFLIPIMYYIFSKLTFEKYHLFKNLFHCWFFPILFLIFLSKNLDKIWYYFIAGIIAPFILQLFFGLGFQLYYRNISTVILIIRPIFISLLISLLFWFIAVWRPYKLPEKDLNYDN